MRLKTPAGYKIPAHQHPTAKTVTVISGDFRFGMGDKLDDPEPKNSELEGSWIYPLI